MTRAYGILTPFQKDVLKEIGREPLLKDFYLTGGTALAAFYLKHRLSDDLDFFTQNPQGVARIPSLIKSLAKKIKARVTLGRRFETLFECALLKSNQRLEMDFALDMPGKLKPTRPCPGFNFQLDNLEDIACNKLSALYERSEPKDFVDIYFLHQKMWPLPKLMAAARRKYPELDDYGLAMAFFKIKGISLWPKMVIPFHPEKLRDFFLQHAETLTHGMFKSD